MLRGRFTAIQAYLKKQEKHQINNLSLHLKQHKKEEQKNPKVSRRKKITKTRIEIIEDYSKNQQNQKLVLHEDKIDKPLDSSRKKGRRIKSVKLEMKMEKSQQTTQKYKKI